MKNRSSHVMITGAMALACGTTPVSAPAQSLPTGLEGVTLAPLASRPVPNCPSHSRSALEWCDLGEKDRWQGALRGGRLEIHYENVEGHSLVVTVDAACHGMTPGEPRLHHAVYDFDGDGARELLYVAQCDPGGFTSGLLTPSRGQLLPYPPAAGLPIIALEDFDTDGRPDLRLAYMIGVEPVVKRCSVNYDTVLRNEHLAHTLSDGSFSVTDEVAVAFARAQCPTRPSRPFGDTHTTPSPLIEEARCARLWGGDSDALWAAFVNACARQSGAAARCRGVCGSLQDLVRAQIRFQPPLFLAE